MPEYRFGIENLQANDKEFEPLFRQHYAEMAERLQAEGCFIGPYNPDKASYIAQNESGGLVHYTVRTLEGRAVGYGNIYLYRSMHTQEYSALEDTIYILPAHRNGVGRKFLKSILEDLKRRGVRQLQATAMTDPRAAKLWQRIGFKPVATVMVYDF